MVLTIVRLSRNLVLPCFTIAPSLNPVSLLVLGVPLLAEGGLRVKGTFEKILTLISEKVKVSTCDAAWEWSLIKKGTH